VNKEASHYVKLFGGIKIGNLIFWLPLVFERVREGRNILQTIKRRKVNWIAYIFRWNYLLQHVTECKIDRRVEVTGRWGRGCKELLDELKEKRGYWKLKQEGLNRTVWRPGFERCYEPVIRQATEW